MAITCFYFDYATRKEQSAAGILGSLLKQVVFSLEGIPEEISRAFQERRKAIGESGPQLIDIVRVLQLTTSSQPTFIVIDALDECAEVERFKLFDSLKQILEKSPGIRVFVTGRPHIRDEIEQCLAGRVISVSVALKEADIIAYLRDRLDQDVMPDVMDENLEADILREIPENISGKCAPPLMPRT